MLESCCFPISTQTQPKQGRSAQIGGADSIGLQVEISDSSALTADDYTIRKDAAGTLVVLRSPGGEEVTLSDRC